MLIFVEAHCVIKAAMLKVIKGSEHKESKTMLNNKFVLAYRLSNSFIHISVQTKSQEEKHSLIILKIIEKAKLRRLAL